jgi:hypothetical protein|tara:strand:- start:1867 stop:2121 length:255 start_codon:yes stop_codon:yes gene_type:complete
MSKKVISFISKHFSAIAPVSQAAPAPPAPQVSQAEADQKAAEQFAEDEDKRRRVLGRSSGQGGLKKRSIMGEPVETTKKTLLGQ